MNITLFAAGSYAAFHYSDALVESLLPGWLAWLHWLLYPLLAVALLILTYYSFSLMANLIAAPFNSLLAAAVEKAERDQLRREYLAAIRGQVDNHLLATRIVDSEGVDVTPQKLRDAQEAQRKPQ